MFSIVLMFLLAAEQCIPPTTTVSENSTLIVDMCESHWSSYILTIGSWSLINLPAYVIFGQALGYFFQARLPTVLRYPKLLGIGTGLLLDFLYRSSWEHMVSTLMYHADEVKNQLQKSSGNLRNLTIVGSCFNSLAPEPDVISMSIYGITRPYWQLLEKARRGVLFFVAAGNDGVPATTHLRARTHNLGQARGAGILPWISEKFDLWCYREKEFQAHFNVIHCGVCTTEGLQLVHYSNFPAKSSNQRFLAVALPKECPEGTSMAAPVITGVFCKLKTTYPHKTNAELINLMFRTARYIQYGLATALLYAYQHKCSGLTLEERNRCRSVFIDTLQKSGLPPEAEHTSSYGSVCEHYKLLQALTKPPVKKHQFLHALAKADKSSHQFLQQLESLNPYSMDDTIMTLEDLWRHFERGPIYTIDTVKLFAEAARLWGTTATLPTAHNTASSAS